MNAPESIFYKLLLRKISGELTAKEQLLLADLLKAFPEFSEVYATVQWLWQDADVSSAHRPPEQSSRLLERHMQRLHDAGLVPETRPAPIKRLRTYFRRRYIAAAAAILLLMGASLIWTFRNARVMPMVEKRYPNMVMTRPGSRTKLILPDGTAVWLNASSKLTYGDDFLQKERRVQLDGEAFFEVTKNDGKPFIIHTDVMDVRVLGTSLNVRSYGGDKNAEAVLIRGKIEVQVRRRPQERYLLSALEKLCVAAKPDAHPRKELTISNVALDKDNTIAETAWMDNQLTFTGEPLSELSVRMERWFDIQITVTGTRLQQFKMTGSFKDESPEQALRAISMIAGCKYTLKDHIAQLYE